MMRTAILWLRMYPFAAAWITVAALNSLAYTAGIFAPATVLGFLSGGLLKHWAIQHNALSIFLAVLAPFLLIRWAAKMLMPGFGDENTWPSADRTEHAAMQRTLHGLPLFRVCFSLFALWFLAVEFTTRAQHLSAFAKFALYVFVFALSLIVTLRGAKKPELQRSADQATA